MVEQLALDEPFEFAAPQPASPAELEAMRERQLARAAARQAALPAPIQESEAERTEREALAANDFNPVLPR